MAAAVYVVVNSMMLARKGYTARQEASNKQLNIVKPDQYLWF
jgi:hypothetical protein